MTWDYIAVCDRCGKRQRRPARDTWGHLRPTFQPKRRGIDLCPKCWAWLCGEIKALNPDEENPT